MVDFMFTRDGDLEITLTGDIAVTSSVCQAVRTRLLWFRDEWRLSPTLGIPYFEDVFVKNPNEAIIRHDIREAVMDVDEVTDVTDISISIDRQTRTVSISVEFTTDEDTFREEVNIAWHMD